MVFAFSQSPVWIGFLNKVFSVVTEEVMHHNDIAKHLQLTSNIKKTPQKKSSLKCLSSQLGLFGVFQRQLNSGFYPHDPYMHINKMYFLTA